jgi:DNA-binding LacI/PurR family transcriptional regulator
MIRSIIVHYSKPDLHKSHFIPIYQRLTDFYQQKILSQEYLPDQRIDSISRIMDRHSVSRETAKLVLKRLINEGLVVSKAGKGTFINSQKSQKKIWGMIVPFYSSNIEQLIGFLQDEARKRGRKLIYFFDYNNAEEEKQLVGKMIFEGYEAIIVVPNYNEMTTAEFYRKLIPGNTRVMLVDNTMAGSYFRYVIQSYDLGVKRALDYLVLNGIGNLLLVKNEIWKGRNLLHELMEHTFRTLIEERYPERKLNVIARVSDLNINYLRENEIGGILCCIDTDAIRVVGRLKQWKLQIPEEVSVVSYGDTELTKFFDPPITAIDCKYEEMACRTAQLLDENQNNTFAEQYVIQPELIIRKT